MKFRHELKHNINHSDLLILKSRLSAILAHDENSGEDGTYFIKSLYFDNYTDKVLREKLDGVDKREKFRIRYYGKDTSFIRLEKKSKINGLCNKVSARITAEQCEKIINGDTAFLLESDNDLLKELYAKMKYQLIKPKTIVAYKRECFVHGCGNVRITLDSEISGSSNVYDFLNPDARFLRLYDGAVLEEKWDECIPNFITDAVKLKGRKASAFSKYAAVRF